MEVRIQVESVIVLNFSGQRRFSALVEATSFSVYSYVVESTKSQKVPA